MVQYKCLKCLIRPAKEMGVTFFGCRMTVDVMGVKKRDPIDEVDDTVGGANETFSLGQQQDDMVVKDSCVLAIKEP